MPRAKGKKQSISSRKSRKKRNTLIAVGIILVFTAVMVVLNLTTANREAGGPKGGVISSTPDVSPSGLEIINLKIGGMF